MNQNMYEQMIEVVKDAGNIIRSASLDDSGIYDKEGFSNFVTRYDKEVQEYLISHFRRLLPDAHYLAEEEGMQQSLGDGYCFIIDPIDGTTNFIFDYKHSCISVGLAFEGRMVFGIVHQPYLDETYVAIEREGAWLNEKRIHCSEKGLEENLVAFGCARYNSDDTDKIFDYAKTLYLHSLGIRNGGSSTLDICRVASGRNGLYLELMLQPWDYAAASLILIEAGGLITQIDGEAITLDAPCPILAGSQKCHEETLKRIGQGKQVEKKEMDKANKNRVVSEVIWNS